MTDSVKRIEEEVVIVEEGKKFRVWVEEERSDWTPASVEHQIEQEGENEDWDLMSEEDESVRRSSEIGEAGNDVSSRPVNVSG
ncbi:hypothetical protein Hanom_Chr09g00853561 [Helianthus anomalus]